MNKIKIHYDGSVSHIKVEFPETEFHMRTENLQELKDAFIKSISNTFDMAISSDINEIKEKARENRNLQREYFEDMTNGMLNKYYNLQVFRNADEISLCSHVLVSYPSKKYNHVKLVHIEALKDGQAYFITDDGSYLMLPWCYIISMIPSINQGE